MSPKRNFIHYLIMAAFWVAYLPFVLFVYLVAWADRKLHFKLSFPRDLNELEKKKQWCINTLKKNKVLPQTAQIIKYTVTSFKQELIFRSNAGALEIVFLEGGKEQTLKCFVKFAPVKGSVWNRTIFNLQMNHIKESWFNQFFVAKDQLVPAPKVYFSECSLFTGNLCLITEFMEGGQEYIESVYDSLPDEHLCLAVKRMAEFHALYWKNNSARMKRVFPIGAITVYFFDSMVARSWSINARNILVQSWRTMNEFQTIVHGDARIGNMMFPSSTGNGWFVFIDWQAVRKGKAVYDLAYFLILSLTSENRKRVEQQCLADYFNALQNGGVRDYSKTELEEDYNHACLCVLVLLSLPMLSGEASAEGDGTKIFAWGMNVWRERMQIKFSEFDYGWMANRYHLSEQDAKNAVMEMLGVIEQRVKKMRNQA